MNYEGLLQDAHNANIHVIEKVPFDSDSKGLIKNNIIGLNKNLKTDIERSCILAEELGHYHTTVGDILDQSSSGNRKQEYRARLWSYDKMVGLIGLIKCFNAGCRNSYEMAEHLGVTEDFLSEALSCYREKYGICTQIDNHVVYFEPSLGVFEVI